MPTDTPENCKVREQLENLVQHHLRQLAELAHKEIDVVKTGDRGRILDVDKRIEETLGEKERTLGALNGHREEHGC